MLTDVSCVNCSQVATARAVTLPALSYVASFTLSFATRRSGHVTRRLRWTRINKSRWLCQIATNASCTPKTHT